jgi:hypothetical protein
MTYFQPSPPARSYWQGPQRGNSGQVGAPAARAGIRRKQSSGQLTGDGPSRPEAVVRLNPRLVPEPVIRRPLLDDLVGARQQRRRHRDAERTGSLQIEDQLVFRGLLDR